VSTTLFDIIERMRKDVGIRRHTADTPEGPEGAAFAVTFESSDPELAQKTVDRLASMFVTEDTEARQQQAEAVTQFVDSQIGDVRRRLAEAEQTLTALRTRSGGAILQADLIPFEVLQERYKELLVMREESQTAINLERRQIGEQFKVWRKPRLPDRPVGPNRTLVNVGGALAGLAFGVVLVGVRRRT
jgi:uncharacterized protein involved in exopolysaccharide biosynthesis